MNRRILTMIVAASSLAVAACDASGDARTTASAADSASIDAIAGDKATVALVLRRAHEKGTFDDAMADALKDSALAGEVVALLRDDPRFALGAETPAGAATARPVASLGSTAKRGAATQSSRSKTTSARKGDVLDQAESGVKKANERLDQAARVKNDAAEAKRKIEDILGRR
jgi:hypothetical protein